jgi:hypothetical protein
MARPAPLAEREMLTIGPLRIVGAHCRGVSDIAGVALGSSR